VSDVWVWSPRGGIRYSGNIQYIHDPIRRIWMNVYHHLRRSIGVVQNLVHHCADVHNICRAIRRQPRAGAGIVSTGDVAPGRRSDTQNLRPCATMALCEEEVRFVCRYDSLMRHMNDAKSFEVCIGGSASQAGSSKNGPPWGTRWIHH
jgi:hypothetical protein